MLSFVGFVSYTLVLSTTLGAVKPLALSRAGDSSRVLCAHTAADEDLHRRIVTIVTDDSYADEDFHNGEDSPADRALDEELFEYDEGLEDVGEDRTDLEWKKIGRYIKRQLKVPRRYLKKIVRTLNKVTKLRSLDGSERMFSVVSPSEEEELQTGENGDMQRGRLLFVKEPLPMRYLAVIPAPRKQFVKIN